MRLDIKSYFIVIIALLWKRVNSLQGNHVSCLFVVFLSCTTHIADSISWFQMQRFRLLAPDASLLSVLSQCCGQCQPLVVAHLPIVFTYVVSTVFEKYNIQPLPASCLTPQLFYMDVSSQALHKTLKVYLAAIQLDHLEQSLK